MEGLETKNGETYCAECGQKVSKDGKLVLNFCPKCGNALTIEAGVSQDKKISKEKLVMLYEMQDRASEGEDINSVLEEFINDLKEEI